MKRTLLSLLSILVLSTTLNAQDTYLVANGTTTNSYVPIYGFYTEQYQRCQTIYPSSMLEEINGGQILSIKYFLSSTSSSTINSIFQVKIGEVTPSSFSSSTFQNTTNFQTVYTGTFNTTQSTLTITFDEPYSYSGGNLLIEVNDITPSNYSSCSFYGISQTGGSSQGYSSSSWSSVSGTIRNFIPKTEFTAEVGPQTCPKPTMSDPIVDDMTATINWTENGTATQYAIYLNNNRVDIVNDVTTYTFRNLTPITDYTAKVRAICGEGDTSFAASKSFTTPCITESLPYNEGFEGFATGTSNFPQCWTSVTGSNYVQANTSYTTYSATGNNCLHIGGPGTVVTPPFASNGRPIEVVFSAKCNDNDAGTLQVGFTNDPTNMNNVQWALQILPSNSNHNIYEAQFTNTGTTSTGYVVFKQSASYSYDYYWIDDVYIGVLSDCRKPESITVHTVDRTGAGIAWEPPISSTPDAYYFEWKASGTTTWHGEAVRDAYKFMTGLTMGTSYDIRVRSVCGSDTSRDVHTSFTTPACDLEIAGGATTNSYVPFYSLYSYGYSQMIYPASQLGSLDTIYGISFYLSAVNTKTYTIDCYIGHTTSSSVSTSSYIASSTLSRKVQNRQIQFSEGWNYISFSSPFVYDGTSNIVIAIDNNTGSYQSGLSYRHHTSTGGNSVYWYQDGTDIYPSQPSASSSNTVSTVPDIKFSIPCTQDACQAPLLVPSEIESHSVTLHWEPMGSATSWKVEYKLSTAATYTMVSNNVTAHEYTLNDLMAGVTYNFRVTANCTATDNSAEVSAFTKCDLFDITYREDFGTGRINPCWAVSQTSAQYPTVIAGVLYTGPDAGTWVILPEFNEPINNLMVNLTAEHSSGTGELSIGITNGQDISSYEELETFEYSTEVSEMEVYLDTYTGTGTNIALKFNSGTTNIDNIVVSRAPSCRKPTNIRVVDVDASTATLTWDAGANATGATVRYRRAGARWNIVEATGNTVTLTNLVANNLHEVIVRAICDDGSSSDNSKTFTFRTGCADGSTPATERYPFIEDFENGLYCWQQEFEAQNLEWKTQKGDGEANAGAHGIDNAYLDHYNAVLYNLLVYTSGPKTRLISPVINTESLAEPWLRYAYGLTKYTSRENNQQYFDELSVYYRTTTTGPWVQLKSYTTATTGWVLDSVQLPATSATFQISFLGYFKGGNGVALDDVRVYTAGHDTRIDDNPPVGIEDIDEDEAWSFRIFPNPASGSTTISIEGVSGRINIAVMDMSGRIVRSENRECYEGCTQTLALQGLAQGAYFVRVSGEKVNSVKKLVVR